MSQEEILSKFISKKGNEIIFRYPSLSDAEKLTEYINTLSCERTYITFQGEQLTLEEEKEHITKWVDEIKEKKSVVILGFHNDTLIACASLTKEIRVSSHVAKFGISIKDGYRNEGIGTLLLEKLLELAKEIDVRMVELQVFANNEKAQYVYQKLGFKEVGRIPERVLHQGKYVDEIVMVKKLA